MAVIDNIREAMQHNEERKKVLRKSILMLMKDWKNFEEDFDMPANCLRECFHELEAKEKHLNSFQESVMESSKELEKKEEEFRAFRERETRDLECKWKEFDGVVKSTEEKLNEQEKMVERQRGETEFEHKMLEVLRKSVENRFSEIAMKEKEFEERSEELNKIEGWVRKETDALHLQERKFIERVAGFEKEMETKERGLDSARKELMVKENELREKEHNLDSIQKEFKKKETTFVSGEKQLRIEEHCLSSVKKELKLKDEKSVDAIRKKLEFQVQERLRKRDVEQENFQKEQRLFKTRMEDVALKEKQVEVRCRELKQREKHIDDRFKLLEEKEKQLKTISSAPVKAEPIDYVEVDRIGAIATDSTYIRFSVTMDGKSLQIYLNEHANELDSMSDQVYKALQLSPNPGKLVLDAMEGFYPPHVQKGDTEFEGSVARKSCILILEQLIRITPKIQPVVRESGLELAREWKVKVTGDQLEILGFLYLLASYSLVPNFDADELMNLLTTVVEHNKSKDLCRLLGFTEKISFYIQNLIAKQQPLEAIKFAYAFELVDHFPPIPILKDYVMRLSESVDNREMFSVEEKNVAIEQNVAAIRAVMRCIVDHGLQSQYPLAQLEEYIGTLTRQKADATTSLVIEAQKPKHETQLKLITASTCPLRERISELEKEKVSFCVPNQESISQVQKAVKKRKKKKAKVDRLHPQPEHVSQFMQPNRFDTAAASTDLLQQPISQVRKATMKQQQNKKPKVERLHQQPQHPNQFMQHNTFDAGGIFRNFPGHFMVASGVPQPFFPWVNPFYHHQNSWRPSYFS